MLYICGIYISDARISKNCFRPEVMQGIYSWANQHKVEDIEICVTPNFSGDFTYYIRLTNCVLSSDEIDDRGMVHIDEYVGKCTEIHVVSTQEEREQTAIFTLVENLEKLFAALGLSNKERDKLLDKPLRDILLMFKQAANNITEDSVKPSKEGEISLKKALLSGIPVTCEECHMGVLHVIDGEVICPLCRKSYGDIDNLK